MIVSLLLILAACGGSDSGPETPASIASQGGTSSAERATETPTVTGSGTPDIDSSVPATPRAGSPVGSPELAEVQPDAGERPADETGLPAGIIIGTPRSDEPIVRETPRSDTPAIIPTPMPSTFDSDGDGLLSVPELTSALRATYPSYSWPPGYELDLDAVIAGIEAEAERFPVFYENGSERTMLVFPYLCAWQYTLRDAMFAGDEERIAESIERLREELAANPQMVTLQEIVRDAVDRAELGDPAPLQMMLDGMGCATMQWESDTPETATSRESGSVTAMMMGAAVGARRRDGVQA